MRTKSRMWNLISSNLIWSFCILLLLAVFIVIFTPFRNNTALSAEKLPFKEGELIIQLFDKEPPKSLQDDFRTSGLKPKKLLSKNMNIWLYEYKPNAMTKAEHQNVLNAVRLHDGVSFAQFNHRVELRSTIPDDPLFSAQWALNNAGDTDIDAPEVWDSVKGDTTVLGKQIVIAVIDDGCDLSLSANSILKDVPIFELSLFKNFSDPTNGLDDDENGYIDDLHGWNAFTNNDEIPATEHGTQVAGICGARGNNKKLISGVNWNVSILPVVGASQYEEYVLIAYDYVLTLRKKYNETNGEEGAFIVVANSSFGIPEGDLPIDPENFVAWCAFYDSLGHAGILSVASTVGFPSSQFWDVDLLPDMPSSCASDYLITVSSVNINDELAGGYGLQSVDLGAPGVNVVTTNVGDGNFAIADGTSIAAPHVSGAVALMYSAARAGFIEAYKGDPATWALKVKEAILGGTVSISSLEGVTVSGGRLNLFNSYVLMRQYFCCIGIRGDVNGDGNDLTILDLNYMVNDIFRNGPSSPCPDEADLDSDGNPSTIVDLNFLVNKIFRNGPNPGPC